MDFIEIFSNTWDFIWDIDLSTIKGKLKFSILIIILLTITASSIYICFEAGKQSRIGEQLLPTLSLSIQPVMPPAGETKGYIHAILNGTHNSSQLSINTGMYAKTYFGEIKYRITNNAHEHSGHSPMPVILFNVKYDYNKLAKLGSNASVCINSTITFERKANFILFDIPITWPFPGNNPKRIMGEDCVRIESVFSKN
jgi:hypothetical protein